MMEPAMTVVCIAPRDQWYEKTVSNLQEVKARGAKVIAIGHAGDHQLPGMVDAFIPLPITEGALAEPLLPFLISPILQLFSYEIALAKGTDVDQPRNLAKSVTVE
jgi:glucosamine--fructose-6-phosphate aminotransferase (isomerizing)